MGQEKNSPLGSIASILWGFDMLLDTLEKARKKCAADTKAAEKRKDKKEAEKQDQLAICIDHAWKLMTEYYKETDRSRAYVVAMVLDPRQKYEYFIRQWDEIHHTGMREKMESMFAEFQQASAIENSQSETEQFTSPIQSKGKTLMMPDWDINAWRFGKQNADETELDRYLKAPLLVLKGDEANKAFRPLEWWKGNAVEYPTLARIACELYSVPAMSVEPERVFSGYVPQRHV